MAKNSRNPKRLHKLIAALTVNSEGKRKGGYLETFLPLPHFLLEDPRRAVRASPPQDRKSV